MTLLVATIVEGHGEVQAVPRLLHRIAQHLGIDDLRVLQPIRGKRDRLLDERFDDLDRAAGLARLKLANDPAATRWLILLLVDAEDDCQRASGGESLGPKHLRRHKGIAGSESVACVIANVMFETWLVAGLLVGHPVLDPECTMVVPSEPEPARVGKGWIKQRMPSQQYRETTDQASLVGHLDVQQARERSPSFDKLCRVLGEAAGIG